MNQTPSSCCMPATGGRQSAAASPDGAVLAISHEGMARLEAGVFSMGSAGPETWPGDGEGPVRGVTLSPFWIDSCAVTNQQYAGFVAATGYVTEAQRFGWSFVHYSQLTKPQRKANAHYRVPGLEWWYRIDGANWRLPLGTGQDVGQLRRWDHPVVHVSWHDAAAYARHQGKRLPTEAEWEFACRGGLIGKIYPWGDELTPGGKHLCNIWQGEFPKKDRGDDGYVSTAPARSFKPNGYGLYNMTGNVWEWVGDWFTPWPPAMPPPDPQGPGQGDRRVMRGGSYLCHASYCNRYRCSARTANTPDSSSGHVGFRCVASVG